MQKRERLKLNRSVSWPIRVDYPHVVLRLASQAGSRVRPRVTTRDFEREVANPHDSATHLRIRRHLVQPGLYPLHQVCTHRYSN
jgi:hypothetical protein